jgi:hypothetical protein
MDFVVGYEIHISDNPDIECGICKYLAGKYPKTFNWDGWHDRCKCYITAVLMDEETFDKQELSDLKSALKGTEYKKLEAKNTVKYIPKSFIDWFLENRKQWNDNGSFPLFITENIELIKESYNHYYL